MAASPRTIPLVAAVAIAATFFSAGLLLGAKNGSDRESAAGLVRHTLPEASHASFPALPLLGASLASLATPTRTPIATPTRTLTAARTLTATPTRTQTAAPKATLAAQASPSSAPIVLVTYSNRPSKHLCGLIESSLRHNHRHNIVGWAPNAPLPASMKQVSWNMDYFLASKIVLYHAIVHDASVRDFFPEELFAFLDHDSIVQFGPEEMERRYRLALTKVREMGGRTQNLTALISAEINGPFIGSAPDGPPSGAPWSNLCTGAMMGDRAGMRHYLGAMSEHVHASIADRSRLVEQNDQLLMVDLWRKGLPVALDWFMDLFMSMHVPDDTRFPGVVIDPDTGHGDWRGHFLLDEREGSPTRGKLQSVHSGSFPVTLHWNGFSKESGGRPSFHAYGYEEVISRLEFVQQRAERGRSRLPLDKFRKFVRVFDENLQPVSALEPADICPNGTLIQLD